MPQFILNKLGRDNDIELFEQDGVTPQHSLLNKKEFYDALILKLIEETDEVREASNRQELVEELADVVEVIDAICKASNISLEEIGAIKDAKHIKRGGFEKGLFIKTISIEEGNPKVDHFRASPNKYPEQ